jgi:hypothetical protein
MGLEYIRTESSHEIWDIRKAPLPRCVTVDKNFKEVPERHVGTSLRAIGKTKKDLRE